ncbi:MAG: hypothetical protein NTZ59_08385 [Bacteroidetes bacterium]|jgi:hypothetical protein|nr:hypothetical protein [Bacteroidota bacterium]
MQPNNNTFFKLITPIFTVFIFSNCFILGFRGRLEQAHIDAKVVFAANCILFFISTLCIALHNKALQSNNSKALIRSIMLSTLIKFMVVAIVTFAYAKMSGINKSIYAVYCGMVLYFIYAYLEVKIALKLNKNNGNK